MSLGLILTIIAVAVAGLAAALGIWMERDPNRPPRWAYGLTVLIVLATFVTVVTAFLDHKEAEEDAVKAEQMHTADQTAAKDRFEALKRESDLLKTAAADSKEREEKMADDIARMLLKLEGMAGKTKDPDLQAFVNEEMKTQARSAEGVVEKVAQRIKDQGGDPDQVLAKHLPAEEMQRVVRSISSKPRLGFMSLARGRRDAAPTAADAPPAGSAQAGAASANVPQSKEPPVKSGLGGRSGGKKLGGIKLGR